MRQSIGESHLGRHIDADAFRIARRNELQQIGIAIRNVIRAAQLAVMILDAKRRPLDVIAAAVGEDEVADGACISGPQDRRQRIVVSFFLRHDPHINPILPHRLGKDVVEFLFPYLAHPIPPDFHFRQRRALC